MRETLFVSVYLDHNVAQTLDYSVPKEWTSRVEVGMRVEVPVKNTLRKATISALKRAASVPNVRPIERILSEESELSFVQWKLAEWMSTYYATPFQKVLRCFIPPHVRKDVKQKTQIFLSLNQSHAQIIKTCEELRGKEPAAAQVLEILLQQKQGIWLSDLLKEVKVSRSVVDGLVRKKIVQSQKIVASEDLLLEEDFFKVEPKELNEEQRRCLEHVQKAMDKGGYSTHLIYGVTGSGKTEVYLQTIQAALDRGKSALLLVPEIALTSQTIERLRTRFSEKIAVIHHRRSLGERSSMWEDLKRGTVRVVLGTRSAVFCPIQNLGAILVDEEHDSSYKQNEEAPRYHGRDVAVMRGFLEQCVVLLGSATPSIESRYNASIDKYRLHTLSVRATQAPLPSIRIIDMKKELDQAGGFTHFSEPLLQGIKTRIETGEQTLLFLNRRGYHRMQVCSACRWIVKCPHCDIALTFHREKNTLRCHLCDHQRPSLRTCPQCSATESLQFKGFGTEHVERSLHAIFPEIRTLRMDRDTTQGKNSHEDLFKQFRSHKADVLIGTQMIAKGFHFPEVTLVGILNIDASLTIPDFRSPEHLFQLLIQVAGRSGRSQLPGEVILQTFFPDHPVIHLAAAQDYEAFYKAEIEERRTFGYPPFCRLTKLLFSSLDPNQAQNAAQKARETLLAALPPPTQILPVVPAGHPKIKDFYRFQFIVKSLTINGINRKLISFLNSQDVKIDVDPVSTFF